MALNNDQLDRKIEKSDKAIAKLAERIAAVEGRIAAPPKQFNPVVTTVLAIIGAAVLAFWGWIATTLVQHGNTLAGIRQSLVSLGVKVAANNPITPSGQSDAKMILRQAREGQIQIPGPIVEQAGKSFIDAAKTESTAWDVALDFVSYRSLINSNFLPLLGKQRASYAFLAQIKPIKGAPSPLVLAAGSAPPGRAARFEPLNPEVIAHDQDEAAYLIVDLHGFSVVLDNMRLKHVILKNAHVMYRGAPIDLQDVTFVNCSFEFVRDDRGQQLAQAILATPAVNYQIT